jgi:transcriptional regulator with XRE-family HTH domain
VARGYPSRIAPPADDPLPWSTEPFGVALRAALQAREMSFRDLESRALIPVGNLHDHVSGKRRPPGDDLLRRIAAGLRVEPEHFREYRERRLVEALREVPDVELALSRRVADGTLKSGLTFADPRP